MGKKNKIASYRQWLLQCTCASILQRLRSLTNEEARQLPETQHRRYLQASLTIPLKELLKERLFDPTIVTPERLGDNPGDTCTERSRVEKEREQYQRELAQLVANAGILNLAAMPDVRESFERRLGELQRKITACDAKLEHIAAVTLQSTWENEEALWKARDWYQSMVEEHGDDRSFWRDLVEHFVEKIVVDLETATFTVYCPFSHEALKQFTGVLVTPDRSASPRTGC